MPFANMVFSAFVHLLNLTRCCIMFVFFFANVSMSAQKIDEEGNFSFPSLFEGLSSCNAAVEAVLLFSLSL